MNSSIKGVYLVSEEACLIPGSGAYKHINAGLVQLSKYYDIEMVQFCKSPVINNSKVQRVKKSARSSELKRIIKWFYILIKNHLNFISYYKTIKKIKPDFVYERSSFLNFNGILISKILGIPHMYEVNGILSKDNQQYFPDLLNRVSFWLEKKAYQNTFGFYVGGINESFNIKEGNFNVIQNGIEEEYLFKFKNRENIVHDKICITFIGHAMPHHRLDILVDALNLLETPEAFRIYLIGSNLESIKSEINPRIDVVLPGSLSHDEISVLMNEINVGIIPFALPYFSHVKAFMYGGSKLLMMVPEVRNFKSIFSNSEVKFIKNGDPKDLSDKLSGLIGKENIFNEYGNNIYIKVANNFTWEKIYKDVAETISLKLGVVN